jgi:NADH:ubiquinone oxidoreductase subunit E
LGSCSKSLLICTKGKACSRRDSADLLKGLKKIIKKRGMEDFYEIKKASCFGLCKYGPVISIDEAMYGGDVPKKDYKQHSKKSKPVKRLLLSKKK